MRLSRYRFVTLGVVWCAYLVVFLSRLCVGPLAPFLKDAFDLSNAQIGGLTSATAVAYAPTLIFAGWLVDRIGVRRALLIGTVITGVCIGAVALAPSYGTMLLLLGASGLGCGFIYPTAVKAIMLLVPAQGAGHGRRRQPVRRQRQRHARGGDHARGSPPRTAGRPGSSSPPASPSSSASSRWSSTATRRPARGTGRGRRR